MSETAVAATAAAPKPSLKTWWTLVKTSVSSWLDDYAPSMGAALSYYTVFSLAPRPCSGRSRRSTTTPTY